LTRADQAYRHFVRWIENEVIDLRTLLPLDLLVVVEQDARFDEDYMFESGWGLLYLVLVAVPLVVLAVRTK
jgi:hypothetical protein